MRLGYWFATSSASAACRRVVRQERLHVAALGERRLPQLAVGNGGFRLRGFFEGIEAEANAVQRLQRDADGCSQLRACRNRGPLGIASCEIDPVAVAAFTRELEAGLSPAAKPRSR